ncbi:MAG: RHS repeat-associated core domain-containing protein [Spirochaetes bacterium]|nr:RHS repeat-associated core domain-containing protein [Spirochaetota bacterium]
MRLLKNGQFFGAPVVTYEGLKLDPLDSSKFLMTRISGNGVQTEIKFDKQNVRAQSVKTTLADGATLVENYDFSYDSMGNVTGVTDNLNANKNQNLTYDNLYRLKTATSVAYGNLTYDYTACGNLTKKDGVNFTYGDSFHPQAVTNDGTNSYVYDANGNMTFRKGRSLVYDAENRLVQVKTGATVKESYVYNHAGKRTIKTRSDGTIEYIVGEHYQVVQEASGQEKHTKFVRGMKSEVAAQVTRDGASVTLVAMQMENQALLNRIAFYNTNSLTGLGQNIAARTILFFRGVKTTKNVMLVFFLLTSTGLLIFIIRSNLLAGKEHAFRRGRRFAAGLAPALAVVCVFQFGFAGCSTTSMADDPVPWGDLNTPVPPTTPNFGSPVPNYDDTTSRGFPAIGIVFMHPNHLGSVSVMTDASGAIVSRVSYKPYGEIIRDPAYSNGPDITPVKYTGQREDAETGLYDYGARFFDPALGRFISADSVIPDANRTQDYNRYMYVRGNPLRYNDPTGHAPDGWNEPKDWSFSDFTTPPWHYFTGPTNRANPEGPIEGATALDDVAKDHDKEGKLGRGQNQRDREKRIEADGDFIWGYTKLVLTGKIVSENFKKRINIWLSYFQDKWGKNNGWAITIGIVVGIADAIVNTYVDMIVGLTGVILFAYNIIRNALPDWLDTAIFYQLDNAYAFAKENGSELVKIGKDLFDSINSWHLKGRFQNIDEPRKWRISSDDWKKIGRAARCFATLFLWC